MGRDGGFGALLRRYRRDAGLTQEALAERAGYSAVYVGMLERGRRAPQPATVRFLAEALALAPRDRALLEAAAESAGPAAQPGAGAPSPAPLVGRDRELGLLDRHLAGTGPPVLLLAGEPGIGKTRLLEEAARRAPGRGWVVLRGGCRRGGQDPYAPLLGALERHLRDADPAQRQADLAGCAWLARLLPELAGAGLQPPPWAVSPAQERRLAFGAVARYLANAGGPTGTLLLLDDLQWAGADALDLLAALIHPDAPAAPPRVIAAYRDTEAGPTGPLAAALADLAHAGLAVRHALAPLSDAETRRLLAGLLGPDGGAAGGDRERFALRAGGVPFFVVSWVQARRAGVAGGGDGDAVPWDAAQSIRQRVAALPPLARELLRAAALADRSATAALLTAVVPGPGGAVADALEAACAAGLLAEQRGEGAYRVAHELIREVVEADLGAARRVALHRRIAEALEAGPGAPPVEALAYHYRRSTAQDRAAHYLAAAGDQALARSAHAAAAEQYRALVDCLDALGRTADAAAARERLAGALGGAARYGAALPPLERAATLYRAAGDLAGLARATAGLGALDAETGAPDRGIARVRSLVDELAPRAAAPGVQGALGRLYIALGHLYFFSGRPAEALAAAERAATAASAGADAPLLALAETIRGNALRMVGRVAEARPVMAEAARLAEAAGATLTLLGALDNLARDALARGAFGAAGDYAARALAAAEGLNNPARVAAAWALVGAVRFLRGEWAAARAALERAVELQRALDPSRLAAYPLAELGRLCLVAGDDAAAAGALEAAVATAERGGDLQARRLAHAALAERDLLARDPAAARDRLLPLLDRPGLEEWQVTELLPLLARAHVETGDVAAAATIAAAAVARARAHEHQLGLVEALRARALVALRQGSAPEAEAALDEALALAHGMGYPHGQARVLHLAGLLAADRGDLGLARARLGSSRAIFQRLGARQEAEQVARALDASYPDC